MRIGFMGGTFSPPHIGHLHSARVFYREAGLSKLIIIPAGVSPFKANTSPSASTPDRLSMAKLCFLPLNDEGLNVEVSDMEASLCGASYTINTIMALKEIYSEDELFMFVGSDMFLSLERWKSFEEIFRQCKIYTRARDDSERQLLLSVCEHYRKEYGADITVSDDKALIASSTEVRLAVESKKVETMQNLLTGEVLRYIIENRLYSGEDYDK